MDRQQIASVIVGLATGVALIAVFVEGTASFEAKREQKLINTALSLNETKLFLEKCPTAQTRLLRGQGFNPVSEVDFIYEKHPDASRPIATHGIVLAVVIEENTGRLQQIALSDYFYGGVVSVHPQ